MALSPKFQDHPVGLPVEVSVKVTVWPAVGELGEKVKAAVGIEVVGGVVEEGVPPPQPATTRQASIRNRSRRIFIGLPTFPPISQDERCIKSSCA